jgi:hypothetical protein
MQVNANRRNAQESTGPRGAEGKARVSRNAITHGLTCRAVVLPEEPLPEFDRYRDAMLADHQQVGAEEQDLVEHMVAAQWRLRRLWRAEAGIYASARYRLGDPAADVGTCVLFDAQQEKGFVTLDRKEATFTREYHRCSRRLQVLQDLRRKGLRHVLDEDATTETLAAPTVNVAAAPAAARQQPAAATRPGAVTPSADSPTRETAKQSQSGTAAAPAMSPGNPAQWSARSTDRPAKVAVDPPPVPAQAAPVEGPRQAA